MIFAQQTFRSVLMAMATPGTMHRLPAVQESRMNPDLLTAASMALCQTLLDVHTSIAVVDMPAGTAEWLRQCCWCKPAPVTEAAFVLGDGATWNWGRTDLPVGTEEEPELGATLILELASLDKGPALRLRGPGIADSQIIAPALTSDFLSFWLANHALYPRGIDLILCCGSTFMALPRSVEISAFEEA